MFRTAIKSSVRHTARSTTWKRSIATDINNGTKGQKTWPDWATVRRVFVTDGYALVGWSVALSGIMFWGPYIAVQSSDAIDHVPRDRGAQVIAKREGLDEVKITVDIPQTYVPLDKGDDDE
ncbi:uncharacterized protein LODBEIA_P10790 [Lodderomyces beijingensis]|uniref:Uncharacterized protein n=1 Tax=Lodderomyces beijingensis TaxID=1775926 RepID=A0ABP0ZKQ2_9ASCO